MLGGMMPFLRRLSLKVLGSRKIIQISAQTLINLMFHCLSRNHQHRLILAKRLKKMDEDLNSFGDDSNSANELSQSGVSFEDPNQVSASREQIVQRRRRRRTPNDSEDDGTEGVKRMKGLEDLGMGVVSSLKRKRSQVARVHEFLKRKNRRRPLTKVLESTVMVSVPVTCEQLPGPSGSPLLGISNGMVSELESNESKRSFAPVLNNLDSMGVSCENGISLNADGHASDVSLINHKQKENEIVSMSELPEKDSSDKLFDVPLAREEKRPAGSAPILVSCLSQKSQVGAGGQSNPTNQVETVPLGNEERNESSSPSSGAADIDSISRQMEKGSSKWQSKGKRNTRHTSKTRRQNSGKSRDVDDEPNAYLPEFSPTVQRSLPYRQSRFTLNPKYQAADFPFRNYDTDPTLYDVKLEVKSSYRPQHVPYISLMSKLNGRPITGHPLTIEVLDDGFCDLLVSGPECYLSSMGREFDDDLEENISAPKGAAMDYQVKPNPVGGRVPKKHLTLKKCCSPSKSSKNRKNGLSSRKTRKLSSLTGSRKQSEDEKKPLVDKLKGPALACVPLKVVFSRINASLNGSMRLVHRAMTPEIP
ncbi:Tudor/PWWP/MBT superfamily protein [Actinidia rufa]|uniref:Tudor/PWWP/MBT superfamily protein n=1 Tax=Actinidia rufa TaxID=165716 RepID=A0A7J0GBC2_9ERIC|nr:Tudor/PWWP/MBT superfamily protein [Actinidia rufa]